MDRLLQQRRVGWPGNVARIVTRYSNKTWHENPLGSRWRRGGHPQSKYHKDGVRVSEVAETVQLDTMLSAPALRFLLST
jgi:hypothetical protein